MVYYDKSSRGFRTGHHNKPYGRDRQRGHYNNRNRGYNQGPPKEDTFEHRLSNLILRVGDNISKNLQQNLEALTEILEKDYAKHSDFILDIFEKCISELPHKSSIYGTLVGLLTARNYDLGGAIVNRASTGFSHALETGDWRRAKILLRFFAELVNSNMILSSTLIAIYNNLLSVFNEENPIKDRVDCMVELVLASLPWAARDLSERNPHDFNRMFESIEKYINTRKSLQDPRLQVLTVHQKGYSGIPGDKLELLWAQMLKLKEQNWDAQILPKPYTLFESTLGSALQHDVPEFTPVPHDSSVTYPTPTNVFFCYSEHLTKCQSPAYYIISDVISDLIDLMEHNRRECIKYILSIPSSFPDDTFYTAKEVDPEQEAGEIDNPISLLSLEKIIIESIFNKVLTLPNPCHKPVYYGVLIVEGIKSSPVAFTYALKSAIPGIYEQISDIDIGCINRLYNWFSHYLSHIEYKWDFDSFGQVWDLEFVDFRRVFVAGTLEKCIRLAYYERIKEAISEPMQALIGDLSPEPSYKYKNVDENTPQGKLKKQIDSFVQSKADINMIKHCVNEANANPELTTDIIREIVIETLLVQGSKSFSHMLNVIERYSGVFTFLIDNDAAKDHLVQLVVSFWSPVPQWMGIQLDKFTNYNLISSSNIINWLFSENAMQHYHRAHVWEILQNTINKLRYWILDIETQIKRLSPDDNMQTDDFDPYADEISSLQTNLTSARQELKNNIFLVFQGFCSILSKYLSHLDGQGRNHNEDTLFRIMAGRFREFGRDYLEIYSPFMVTLENITFTKDVDPRVFSLFAELQSLANPPKFDQVFNFN